MGYAQHSTFGPGDGDAAIPEHPAGVRGEVLADDGAEDAAGRPCAVQVDDPNSDMANLEHLIRRLRHLYSRAVLTAEPVSDRYLLVVVETERSAQTHIVSSRLAVVHRAMRYAFSRSESIVTIPPRRAVALVTTDEPQLSDSLALLRTELKIANAGGRLPTRCWRQRLPREPLELSLTLLELPG